MTDTASVPPSTARPPATHLMAAGPWSILIGASGGGRSQWHELAISRWHPGLPMADEGHPIWLRDRDTGQVWSATASAANGRPEDGTFAFSPNRAIFQYAGTALTSTLTLAPLPDGDGEVRQLVLHNPSRQTRVVDVVSYRPLILGSAAADAGHPAYSKMFVQTDATQDGEVLLAWRRKGSPDDPDIVAAHVCTHADDAVQRIGFETDRLHFIGRGRRLAQAVALQTDTPPAGHTGSVLDPIFSLRRRVTLAPGARVTLSFWTLAGTSREAVLARVADCRPPRAAEHALRASAQYAARQAEAAHLSATDLHTFQQLGASLFLPRTGLRAAAGQVSRGAGGQPTLWAHGISGDRPIVLLRAGTPAHLPVLDQLIAAQHWWRTHGVDTDLVVLACPTEEPAANWAAALAARQAAADHATPGRFFVLQESDLDDAQRDGLATAACIVFEAARGDLAAQLAAARPDPDRHPPRSSAPASRPAEVTPGDEDPVSDAQPSLEYFNGLGGFAEGGQTYAITLRDRACTPMPWVNVIANARFGFMVSAEGGGCTWAVNSQKNTLTPWSNDPVRDPAGDVLYIHDVSHGRFWSATPAPVRTGAACDVRHGHGHTRFRQTVDGLTSDLRQFVLIDDPVKVSWLRLTNTGTTERTVQITGYVHWQLGANGADTAPFIVTAHDAASGALTARNDWRPDYVGRLAFALLANQPNGPDAWTCDRQEFLGASGHPGNPQALADNARLAQRSGAGLDPCAALQSTLTLPPGETREIVFLLGEGDEAEAAHALIARYRHLDAHTALCQVQDHWRNVTDVLQVRTPDRKLDLLVNGWLPYQIISCRMHARAAFYQASGAWGFRDQLQDAGALVLSAPRLVREHLLRSAGRQFVEGDAQHWWLPPSGAGVRTHMADDRLWLPLIIAHYVAVTGDRAVLDETVPFLQGQPLPLERIDDFSTPPPADESASLYEHGARAIEVSLKAGAHGLPLFGTGDWNDGMNRVGRLGRGESVWMAWFLIAVIRDFAPLAEARGEADRAARWRTHAHQLRQAIDQNAWDGAWWLRGWYDDGTPLGASASTDCRIDGIAQSWSVIAQDAPDDRARQAMEAVDRLLVDRQARLVALLTPPFDTAPQDPGYIKGYPPGLRENGGQYTHGSVWAVIAFAQLGDGDRAWELFSLLEPISHADSPERLARWQVEPYVACADVYTAPGHRGRGGWTWYTGTAGWLYRAATEWLLGLRVQGDHLRIDPCIPHAWPGFRATLHWRTATYQIQVDNARHVCHGVHAVRLDGAPQPAGEPLALQDDAASHVVQVQLG